MKCTCIDSNPDDKPDCQIHGLRAQPPGDNAHPVKQHAKELIYEEPVRNN